MSIDLLNEKIESLNNAISLIDDTVKFQIGTMWAVVGVLLAIGLIVIPLLAKTWAKSAADAKLETITAELKEQLLNEVKKKTPVISELEVFIPGTQNGKNVTCINYKIYDEHDLSPNIFLQLSHSQYKLDYIIDKTAKQIFIINSEPYVLSADLLITRGEFGNVTRHSQEEVADRIKRL